MEIARPCSSGIVQEAPTDQVVFVQARASTQTPNLDILDNTTNSIDSQIVLNTSNMLADHDQSMITGHNETIVEQTKKLNPIPEEPKPESDKDK